MATPSPPVAGPVAVPAAMLDALRAAYATPPRAYHHWGHIEAVLGHYGDVAEHRGWRRPGEVYLAVLYHDAIYEVSGHDNEARSAALARSAIERHLPVGAVAIDEVERLITLTAAHGRIDPTGLDDDTLHFLDCDMAILGAAPEAFDAYERAIAIEYAAVPAEMYRAGRAAFLGRLLASPRIFLSAYFRDRLEAAARDNLRRTLGRG